MAIPLIESGREPKVTVLYDRLVETINEHCSKTTMSDAEIVGILEFVKSHFLYG